MTYPVVPVTLPRDLVGVRNGQLSDLLLRPVTPNTAWRMHHLAARAWEAMRAAAWRSGIWLSLSGDPYRTLQAQTSLFLARYDDYYDPNLHTLDAQRTWNAKTWYKLKGVAPVAVPGTSNHGLGLAVDTAIDADGDLAFEWPPKSLSTTALDWLLANAARYGFSWEVVPAEPWHLRYVTGDVVPAAVLAYEAGLAPAKMTAPLPTIRSGSTGTEVSKLQAQCRQFGWYPYSVDGNCGPMTVEAIRRLQTAVTVGADGVYGPITASAYQRWLDAR